jgi:hypothetical protein
MEENKEILLPSKKYAKAPDKELDLRINLDTSESLLRIGDKDIVLDVAELFNTERNKSLNYKIYGKLRMIFRNLYTGFTNYEYLNERLYLNTDGSDNDFRGSLPYDEFAFLRRDVYREVNMPVSGSTLGTFTPNIQISGSTAHTTITPIQAPYQNWNLYLTYVDSHDTNYVMNYTLSGNTFVSFVSGDGIPFRVSYGLVENNATYYELTSPVEHGIKEGEFVTISGTTFSISSVGNEIYNSEKYVINILKSEVSTGFTFNTINIGKRCLDINNISGSTSQYYVHKHKTLTDVNGYIMDTIGFESPIFRDEKKILFENSVGTNDVIVEKNRMESVLYDFKNPFQLTDIKNNLGYTPTEVYVSILLRNGNGYFNYPPKVGYSFHFHDTWIDKHFTGTSSNETSLTGTTFTNDGYTFTGGTALNTGSTLTGAFVEYNPKEMSERIISESYHKFTDRIDIFNHNQTGSTIPINSTVRFSGASVNNPVGLIYQPHYRVKLRELSPYIENATTNDILNLPENCTYDTDTKQWRWRDLYDHGYIDADGYGTNFPFVNNTHYVNTLINFYLRNELFYTNKQDGITNFNNKKVINC